MTRISIFRETLTCLFFRGKEVDRSLEASINFSWKFPFFPWKLPRKYLEASMKKCKPYNIFLKLLLSKWSISMHMLPCKLPDANDGRRHIAVAETLSLKNFPSR